jgi:hypothetical protein
VALSAQQRQKRRREAAESEPETEEDLACAAYGEFCCSLDALHSVLGLSGGR